jgi:hypothetical protein
MYHMMSAGGIGGVGGSGSYYQPPKKKKDDDGSKAKIGLPPNEQVPIKSEAKKPEGGVQASSDSAGQQGLSDRDRGKHAATPPKKKTAEGSDDETNQTEQQQTQAEKSLTDDELGGFYTYDHNGKLIFRQTRHRLDEEA